MDMFIQTVLGKIEPNELGIYSCHEHLSFDMSKKKENEDISLKDMGKIISELKRFVNLGGNSVIELTNDGMGRDVNDLYEISKALKINIIASTGCYKYPFIPKDKMEWTRDDVYKWIKEEIVLGIDGTGIKPGIIGEIGTSLNEIHPIELEMFYGAMEASKETGWPISTHTTL